MPMTDRDIIRLRILLDRAASAMQNGGVVLTMEEIEELKVLLQLLNITRKDRK